MAYRTNKLIEDTDLSRIIEYGESALLVQKAEGIGKELSRQLTTSQIRNVFGTVRQIEPSWRPQTDEEDKKWAERQLLLLKPKLAYQAKRELGQGVQMLADILSPAIDLVGSDEKRFRNFVDFFEAILAYHSANSQN